LQLGTGSSKRCSGGGGSPVTGGSPIKLTIIAAFTGVVLFVLVPGLQAAAETAAGPSAGAFLGDAQRVVFVIAPSVAITLLVLNVILAVYKPTWRVRSRPSDLRGMGTVQRRPAWTQSMSGDLPVTLASRLGAVQRPSRTFPAGRVCDASGCETRLSIYNPDRRCSIHELAERDDVRDAGRAA
jgi:hypothetical protein